MAKINPDISVITLSNPIKRQRFNKVLPVGDTFKIQKYI